jgi:PAS domain S-box-containing protein
MTFAADKPDDFREESTSPDAERYLRLLEAVNGFFYSVRIENGVGLLTRQNEGCLTVTGYRPEDFLSDRTLSLRLVHPDDRDRVWQHATSIGETRDLPAIEYRLVHRDSSTRWVRDTIVRRYDHTGQLVGYDGLVEDITAQKLAEVTAQHRDYFAEALTETSQALIFIVATSGAVLRVTSQTEEAIGFTMDELLGQDFFSTLIPQSDRVAMRMLFEEVCKTHDAVSGVHLMLTKDSTTRQVHWTGKTVREEGDLILYVVLAGHDVTELNAARQTAVELDRLAIVGRIALGAADEEWGLGQEAAHTHPNRLSQQLRDYAAPIELDCRVCQLHEVFQQAWEELAPMREGRDVRLRVQESPVLLDCEASRLHIQTVFRCFLENTLCIAEDPLELQVEWSRDVVGRHPAVGIILRGISAGLAAADQEEIFDPLFTVDGHRVGLRMAIARRFVDAHDGRINITEGPSGLDIAILLPRRRQL